jgi:membrane protease YdiL (CAAX protease family)
LDTVEKPIPVAKPWGLWATLGFGAVILAVYLIVQMLAASFIAAIELRNNPSLDPHSLATTLGTSGFALSLGVTGGMVLCVSLILLFSRLRKGVTVKRYLHLNPVGCKGLVRWIGLIFAFAILWDSLALLLGRNVIPEFMFQVYETAYFMPLLWFALIVAAPLFEELFFRGFLFEGIRHSRLGAGGALILTSLGWAVIHLQYDVYEISAIFALGLVLGAARLKTQSIYTSIAMHAFTNMLATLEVAVYLQLWKNGG